MPQIRDTNDVDLPDDIDMPDDFGSKHVGHDPKTLDALGKTIAKKRDEAMQSRKQSGIEDVWNDCEEAYLGIDDANRNEFAGANWIKPTSKEGPITTGGGSSPGTRSTAYVRLTSRYVDAGTAKLSDILLPIDDKSFSIKADPKPDLIKSLEDHRAAIDAGTGQVATVAATQAELATDKQALAPGQIAPPTTGTPQVPLTMAKLAQQEIEKAEEAAQKAEDRLYSWMIDCRYPMEVRNVIHDAGRLGVGIIKGPVPDMTTSMALLKGEKGGYSAQLQIQKKLAPVFKWIDPWNFFPGGECGEDIHNGDNCFERDFFSAKKLKGLKQLPGYLKDQIDKVLEEGPGKKYTEGRNPSESDNKDRYEVWYCYGQISKEELQAASAVGSNEMPSDKNEVYAVITMVNDTVIKADINPLDTGNFPYNAMPWSRRAGSWAGVGIAEQISMAQRMCNASTRAMLNNAGISSGAQIVIDQGSITPADGNYNITPNKIWFKTAEADVDDVRKAFMSVEFPNAQQQLMSIIEFAFKLAEESCNIPLVTQGINDQKTPDTFGAVQIQDNNANTLLRSIGNTFDDKITCPNVNDLYEWFLLDPDVPDDEKGSFKINAHGSAALVERAIQNATLQSMGEMTLNPAFGANPKKWFAEWLKSKRLDPSKIQYTEEESEQQAKNQAPPIQIQVEQIKQQGAQALAKTEFQNEMQLSQAAMQNEQQALQNGGTAPHIVAANARIEEVKIKAKSAEAIEQSRAAAEANYANTEAQMAKDNAVARLQEMRDKREMLILEYSLKNNLSLEEVKADLAKTAMIEQTKRALGGAAHQLSAEQGNLDREHDMTKHVSALNAKAADTQATANQVNAAE